MLKSKLHGTGRSTVHSVSKPGTECSVWVQRKLRSVSPQRAGGRTGRTAAPARPARTVAGSARSGSGSAACTLRTATTGVRLVTRSANSSSGATAWVATLAFSMAKSRSTMRPVRRHANGLAQPGKELPDRGPRLGCRRKGRANVRGSARSGRSSGRSAPDNDRVVPRCGQSATPRHPDQARRAPGCGRPARAQPSSGSRNSVAPAGPGYNAITRPCDVL